MNALTKHMHPGWLIIAPLLALVTLLYLSPILNILWLSVTDPEPGLGNYAKLGESDALLRIVWTTVRICIITTLFSVTLGYSIAYAMVHCHQRQIGTLHRDTQALGRAGMAPLVARVHPENAREVGGGVGLSYLSACAGCCHRWMPPQLGTVTRR